MAGKQTKTAEQQKAADDAREQAKAANRAKKEAHQQKINSPDPALAAEGTAAFTPPAETKPDDVVERVEPKVDGGITESESLAAKAMNGGDLTKDEVEKVAARALGKGVDFDGAMLAMAQRLDTIEQKLNALTDENTRMMKRMRGAAGIAKKDPNTHAGSIDDLGKIDD